MAQPPSPTTTVTNPRIAKLIELEVSGRIKPEHQTELDTYRANGWAPKRVSASGTESERTAAFLGANVGTAILDLEKINKDNPDALRPYVSTRLLGGDDSLLGEWNNGPDRRLASGAQGQLLDSALTLGTGQAYNKEQLEAATRYYLPGSFDTESELEAKAVRMRSLLDKARIKAGGSAGDIDKAMSLFGFKARAPIATENPEKPTNWRVPGADTGGGDIGFADKAHAEANSLPQGAQQFQQDLSFAIANGDLKTPEDVITFGANSKLNEGRGFIIDPQQAKDVIDSVSKGGGFNVNTPEFQAPDISAYRGDGGGIEMGRALVRGIPNAFGIDDEIGAISDTFQGGTLRDNLAINRAVRDYDEENHGVMRGLGTFAGSLAAGYLLPGSVANSARSAAVDAIRSGAGKDAARVAARYGIAKRMGIEAGALGAAYGFGDSDGNIGDRAIGAVESGLAGYGLGYGMGSLSHLAGVLPKKGPGGGGGASGPNPADMGPIADRLGIEPTPATTGGAFAGAMQAGLGNLPGSMGPVRAAAERETGQLADAARDVAGKLGPRGTPQSAGADVAEGAARWLSGEKAAGNDLYRLRDEMIGGPDAPVVMGNTGKKLAQLAADFPSSPVLASMLEHPAVRKVGEIVKDSAGELTLDEATEALSHIRGVLRNAEASKTITAPMRARIASLEKAIEDDVTNAAKASDGIKGRSGAFTAENAQKQADAHWAQMKNAETGEMKRPLASAKDDIAQSGEGVFREMFTDMNRDGGNIQRLRARWDRLPKAAKESYSATAFDQLGRAKPNAQNAADDAWSFDTFGTNWAKMSDDARKLVFGGRGVDREISDIVRYTERLKQLGRSRNFSNTGETIAKSSYVGAIVSALVGTTAGTGSVTAGVGAATAAASVYPILNMAGRAFLKAPAMRQWLRSTLHASVQASAGNANATAKLQTLVRRLPSIAARDPAISNEVVQLERRLLSAINDNATKAAASGDQERDQ